MTDFLAQLAARSRNTTSALQPRLRGRFEPPVGAAPTLLEAVVESPAETTPHEPRSPRDMSSVGDTTASRSSLESIAPQVATRSGAEHASSRIVPQSAATRPSLPLETRPSATPVLRTAPPREPTLPSVATAQRPAEQSSDRQAGEARRAMTSPESSHTAARSTNLVEVQTKPRVVDAAERPAPDATKRPVTSASHDPPRDVANRAAAPLQLAPLMPVAARGKTSAAAMPAATAPAPVIHVTIGRIEVRAVTTAAAVPASVPAAKPAGPSLDEYLRQRSGGRR